MSRKKVLQIDDILIPDHLARQIADNFQHWESLRQPKINEWREIQQYVFATDTTKTSNAKLPWSNKTVIPKLCQIRDNLVANYMATLFPRRDWISWEAGTRDDNSKEKRKNIESFMTWTADRNEFYDEVTKLTTDYVDFGNCFATVEWKDGTYLDGKGQHRHGYVGPVPRRIAPSDIVFDPTAVSFQDAPKIVRSIVSIGELKALLEESSHSSDEELEAAQKLYTYLIDLRHNVQAHTGTHSVKDTVYQVSGFGSFGDYLCSNSVEVLTFYGDIYSEDTGELKRNRIIKVVDRHKIISDIENPSLFGNSVIFHAGWRVRPDNLWAMGPLDNLVGMQYRIDHLENMKADVFDLIAYPPVKIKGDVEDFDWGPFERIVVGDNGDVELMSPPFQALQADNQIAILEAKMEEMAGSPKEAMGFRSPGEKTAFEVQRLEAAASRIFMAKVSQFERQMVEELLNAMLELARRRMTVQTISSFDKEFNITLFSDLTPQDITGVGRVYPIAARHFAEKSTMVQNLNQFFASAIGSDPMVRSHFSSIKLAKMFEELLDLDDYEIVLENVRISEQANAQKMQSVAGEQAMVESQMPSGIFEGDTDQGI